MQRIPDQEFKAIYNKVPRLCVEVIVRNDQGILLTKRSIEPAKGLWHTPGGTVYYDETLSGAVKRIAKKELGTEVEVIQELGTMEIRFSDHFYHDVSVAFLVKPLGAISLGKEASEWSYFKTLPEDMIPAQKEFVEKKLSLLYNVATE